MSYDVVITAFRAKGGETVATVLEDLFGFEPDKAASLARTLPSAVIQGTTEVHAQIAAEQLRDAGAQVEIRSREKPVVHSLNQAADLAKNAAKMLEGSPGMAQAPASRKAFSTVAMKNIEADLNKFELEGFGPMFGKEGKSAAAFDAPMEELPFEKPQSSAPKKSKFKAELPDVDDLFEAPPQKQVDSSSFDADADAGLDDLFRRPGAEFKRPPGSKDARRSAEGKGRPSNAQHKGWDSPQGGKGGHGAEGKGWDQAASSAGEVAKEIGAEAAKAVGNEALKAIAAKVAAGVAALSIAAGGSAAVINARDASAEAKQTQQMASGQTGAKGAKGAKGGAPVTKLHPAIKMAPAALESSFASILRKRVQNSFGVVVEWEGAPEDMQCFVLKKHKTKHKERMFALEQTGKRIDVPPEGQEQLKEHIETMKAAGGTSKAEYEGICLSVSEHPDGSKPDPEEKARAEAKKRERAQEAAEAEEE